MAVISFDNFNVVEIFDQLTTKAGEDIATGRRGKYMYVGTDGLADSGAGDDAANVGTGFRGFAISDQKYVGDTVTLVRHGLLDYGDAFAAANIGAPVYIADEGTSSAGVRGELSLSSGDSSETAIVGYVWPVWTADGTLKKLLYVDVLAPHS